MASLFKLNLGDTPYGPGDIHEITVVDEGDIAGPNLPNWQAEYMLARCVTPNSYRGEELKYLVLSPRYTNVGLAEIRLGGATVAVGRVLPGVGDMKPQEFEPNQVEYWAIGVLSRIEGSVSG
jgi:hypothetical protein